MKRVFAYGTAQPDSLFEIGSITKTFTGLILARMIAEQKVTLDEPVRALLPPGTVAKPEGSEITLLDLVTQHSGLPRMPDNFHPANPENPYADYHAANLYEFLTKHGVAKPSGASFLYSNLGFGLLGQALADRARMTYPELLKSQIIDPLQLRDTVVALSPEQQHRYFRGMTRNIIWRLPGTWMRLPGPAPFASPRAICLRISTRISTLKRFRRQPPRWLYPTSRERM